MIHGNGIFTFMYHKNQPNVGKYTSPMDPMGKVKISHVINPIDNRHPHLYSTYLLKRNGGSSPVTPLKRVFGCCLQGQKPSLLVVQKNTSHSHELIFETIIIDVKFIIYICAMVKSRYIGDGHPTFNDEIL